MLLDKIGELSSVLVKFKKKSGENESYLFYESILKVMKLSWNTFLDFRNSYIEFEHIKLENEFLKGRITELKNELLKYKVVEHLKLSDELDAVSDHVDKYLASQNSINKLKQHDTGRD